jgi:hypothetical protein
VLQGLCPQQEWASVLNGVGASAVGVLGCCWSRWYSCWVVSVVKLVDPSAGSSNSRMFLSLPVP